MQNGVNMMDRRAFMTAGFAGFALAGLAPVLRLSAAYAPGRKPNMTFGAISDIHVKIAPDGKGMRASNDTRLVVHAFEWFRDQGVDAVMIAGDLADTGLVDELKAVAAAWWQVFPGSKTPGGRHVERVFITGNHDWDAYTYDGGVFVNKLYPDEAERNANLLCKDLKGCWERIMEEPYTPVYHKKVKGYSFVGAHWDGTPCHPKCETAFRHVGKWFDENGSALDPALPFFYCQHAHLQNTVYGPWAWGHDSGETTAALMKLPNAVAFSGHSHYTLVDERSIWQDGFTSLGTASLRYAGTPNDEFPETGFENAWGGPNNLKTMRPFNEKDHQGMLVRVFDDCIAFSRRDFGRDKMLGGDWVMPLPAAKSQPFSFKARRAKEKAPAFPSGAAIAVAETAAKIRGGTNRVNGKKMTVPQESKPTLSLSFPKADAVRETRAFIYEFSFIPADGKTVLRHTLATDPFQPDDEYRADNARNETFAISLDQLPAAPFKIEVRAVSSLGTKSTPLATTFQPAEFERKNA